MAIEDQLLLTLMKIRCNFGHTDLSVRFNVSKSSVTNIYLTITYALHEFLFTFLMKELPSASKTKLSLPKCCLHFPNLRLIIDCTEVKIDKPRNDLLLQKATYSSYKGTNTFKGLVAISPNGTVIYASDLFPGSTSDKNIVIESQMLSKLESGDLILADKGFLIHDIMPPGITVNIPPFLSAPSGQFTKDESIQTQKIAQARIHVERAIQRIKEFSILKNVPYQHYKHASTFFQLCCALVNLQSSIMGEQFIP